MKVIPFPNPQEKVYFTLAELDRFIKLKEQLANSISPGEATYYKNELDFLVARGKQCRP